MKPASQDIAKIEMLRELGYGGDADLYADVLEAAGLSNPRKARIALNKRDLVAGALRAAFIRICSRGDCSSKALEVGAGRKPVPAAMQADCEVCGGSRNRSAVDEMVHAFAVTGWRRLVVVGGSAATRGDLLRQIDGRLEVRTVDGTLSRRRAQADADVAWADRVVIWASTELNHKVSELYRGPKVITARSRGVAELAQAATISALMANSDPSRR